MQNVDLENPAHRNSPMTYRRTGLHQTFQKQLLYQTLKKASPSKSKSTLITQNCRKNEASVRKLKLPYRFTENEALQIAILSSKPPTSPART